MSASGALRELLVFFGTEVDTAPLEKADSLVDKVKKGLVGLAAAFSVGYLVNEFNQVANLADEINDTAAKLGFSTDALQEWRYVAKFAGIEAEALGGAIRKASMEIAGAVESADKAKSFKDLGVALKGANGEARSTEDIFGDTIEALAGITDEQKRAAASSGIFGKSFTELNPLLAQGAVGIAELRKQIRSNGGLLSEETIKRAGEYNDSMDRLGFIATGLKAQLMSGLQPAVTRLTQWLERAIPKALAMAERFKEWLKTSQPLRDALRFVGSMLAIVAARMAPGILLRGVGMLLGKWGAVRGILGRVIATLGRFILRMMIPALLLDDLIVTFQGGDSIIRRILDGWFGEGSTGQVVNWFKGFFSGWDGLTDRVGEFFSFLAEGLNTVGFEIKAAFLGISASIMDAVTSAWNGIVGKAQDTINKLIDLANKIPGVNFGKVDFGGAKGETGKAEMVGGQLMAERQVQAQRLAAATDRAFGTSIRDAAQVSSTINVTVPPGTPATMASRVGAAANRGTQQGLKAAKNALVQKKG